MPAQSLCCEGHSANFTDSLTLLLQPVFHYGKICCNLILTDELAGASRPQLCKGTTSQIPLCSVPSGWVTLTAAYKQGLPLGDSTVVETCGCGSQDFNHRCNLGLRRGRKGRGEQSISFRMCKNKYLPHLTLGRESWLCTFHLPASSSPCQLHNTGFPWLRFSFLI